MTTYQIVKLANAAEQTSINPVVLGTLIGITVVFAVVAVITMVKMRN